MGRTIMGLGQHRLQDVRYPSVTSGAVVPPVGIEILKRLSDVGTGSVGKVPGLLAGTGLIRARVSAHQITERHKIPSFEFHSNPLEDRVGGTRA